MQKHSEMKKHSSTHGAVNLFSAHLHHEVRLFVHQHNAVNEIYELAA
jgi:hypothetical protein